MYVKTDIEAIDKHFKILITQLVGYFYGMTFYDFGNIRKNICLTFMLTDGQGLSVERTFFLAFISSVIFLTYSNSVTQTVSFFLQCRVSIRQAHRDQLAEYVQPHFLHR